MSQTESEAMSPEDGQLDSLFTSAVPVETEQASTPAPEPVQPQAEQPVQPAAAEQPQTQPDPSQTLFENARKLGLSTEGITSAEQLASALMSQVEKMQPHVRAAQELAPYADEIKEFFSSRNKQSQPAQAAQTVTEQWDAEQYLSKQYGGPVFTQEQRRLVEQGLVTRSPETGMWEAKPGLEAAVGTQLADLNAAQAHMTRFWQELSSTNPYAKFYDVLKEPLLRAVRQEFETLAAQREQVTTQKSVVEQFEDANKSWMYQVDPSTGKTVPTPQGNQFFETVQELQASGVTDPATVLKLAQRMTGLGTNKAQPSPQPPATQQQPPVAPPAAPSVVQTLQNAAAATQNSFLESAMNRAGYAPSYSSQAGLASDAAPEVTTPNELDSMFANALRVASASR